LATERANRGAGLINTYDLEILKDELFKTLEDD
jgi:hypothetical protein